MGRDSKLRSEIATLALPVAQPPICAMSGEPRSFTGSWTMRAGLTGLSVMATAQALAGSSSVSVYPGIPGYAGGYPGMYLLGREAIRDSRISGNSDIQITSLLVSHTEVVIDQALPLRPTRYRR